MGFGSFLMTPDWVCGLKALGCNSTLAQDKEPPPREWVQLSLVDEPNGLVPFGASWTQVSQLLSEEAGGQAPTTHVLYSDASVTAGGGMLL